MRACWFLLPLFLVAGAWGDLVRMKDGSTLSGSVRRTPSGWQITDSSGKVTEVTEDQVQSVEKVGTMTKDEMAASGLSALRRSTENSGDIKQVLDRYQKFIAQYPNTPAARDAAKDVAAWQERQDKGLVRYGGKWVSAAELGELIRRSVALVDQARALVRATRPKEAEAIVDKVLADDPTNVAALYVKGVILYKQDKPPLARKCFEQVKAALPDHAPTLNNMAVIMFKQSQQPGAMAMYDQAMLTSPNNKDILNNVAEAIAALSDSERTGMSAQKAIKHFEEQDAALAQEMQKAGLYRWGANWITAAQVEELRKAEAAVKQRLESLRNEYEKIQTRMSNIELEINANGRAIDRINAERWATDPNGRLIYRTPPDEYYRLQRDNDMLRSEQKELAGRLNGFKDRAAAIEQQMPTPKYSGLQQIIGVEGTPLIVPPPEPPKAPVRPEPATLPATTGPAVPMPGLP